MIPISCLFQLLGVKIVILNMKFILKKKLILEFVCRVWKQLSSRLKAVQLVTWPESRACHLQENSLKLKDTAVSFSLDEKFCLMLVISVICKFK